MNQIVLKCKKCSKDFFGDVIPGGLETFKLMRSESHILIQASEDTSVKEYQGHWPETLDGAAQFVESTFGIQAKCPSWYYPVSSHLLPSGLFQIANANFESSITAERRIRGWSKEQKDAI